MLKKIIEIIYNNPIKTGLACLAVMIIPNMFSGVSYPNTVNEFSKTSVKLVGARSGGSGSIIRSNEYESVILTNRHVCEVIKYGGVVIHESGRYVINSYKPDYDHDLCLVRVTTNLGVNLKVADKAPENHSTSIASGHPALMPHIVSKGHFSDRKIIDLVMGIEKCEKGDSDYYRTCKIFGVKPIIESFESQVTSSIIRGGSSGSAVFNEDGEIVAVVFAGLRGGLSHGYVVPQEYIKRFLRLEDRSKWIKTRRATQKELKEEATKRRVIKILSHRLKTKNHMLWDL